MILWYYFTKDVFCCFIYDHWKDKTNQFFKKNQLNVLYIRNNVAELKSSKYELQEVFSHGRKVSEEKTIAYSAKYYPTFNLKSLLGCWLTS